MMPCGPPCSAFRGEAPAGGSLSCRGQAGRSLGGCAAAGPSGAGQVQVGSSGFAFHVNIKVGLKILLDFNR